MLLVVAAALSWAIGTFLSSRLPLPGDAITTAGVQGLTGGLLLIPLGMVLSDGESHNPADWSTRSLLGLLYLVVFGSIFGYTAYVWLVAHVPLGTVATYAYVNPLVAISLGHPVPRRGRHLADRRRRRGDPDLGGGRDPQRGSAAAGRRAPADRDLRHRPRAQPRGEAEVSRPRQISSGRTGTRWSGLPVAARIAATTAAVETTVGGSPTPLTP